MSSICAVPEIATPETAAVAPRRWPALLLVGLGLASYLSLYTFVVWPTAPAMPIFMASMWGPMLCALVLVLWWLAMGPASWRTRLVSLGLSVLVVGGAVAAADPTARFFMISKGIPIAVALVALYLCAAWRLNPGPRLVGALAMGVLAFVPWQLLQFNGVTGFFGMDPQWRWRPSADVEAAAFDKGKKVEPPAGDAPITVSASDWTGFRGPQRDGIATGVSLGDWKTPPKELWRRPVGPGWSSVCVVGDRLFTQEQRGEEEQVTCYLAATGELLWSIGDTARYSDMPSGVGPRGTPEFHDGKLYTFGATGILNCIDAATGKRLWRVDLKETVVAELPVFGFATSPLVVGNQVIVHPGGKAGPRLVAYDALTGKQAWSVGTAGISYSSPQRTTLAEVPQVLVYNSDGLFAHDPATGKELWSYAWKAEETAPVVTQPMLLPEDRIMLGGGRIGIPSRCIKVVRQGDGWATEDVWETLLSPAFNDYVRLGDSIYGLDGGRMFCVDWATGQKRWKDGRYGTGQVLLAGDRIVVQAESGKLALVAASPDKWEELAQVPALSEKTWNHPVIAGGRLFVRNSREMVCYELPK